jgi:hypothetical protein
MTSVAWARKISRHVELAWEVAQMKIVLDLTSHVLIQFNSCDFFSGLMVSTVATYPGDLG